VDRPSERALWTAVIETLRSGVLPYVGDPFAALQTRRLIGLAAYARDRADDPSAHRAAAIRALIGDDDVTAVLLDGSDPRGERLRAVLSEHLDADIADEAVLLEHFRPVVNLASSGPGHEGTGSGRPGGAHDEAEPQ
jgi:hypothetical protein